MPKTKAFSNTKGGAGADDFKKKRVKLGKRVAKPTATDTKFKAARIHMVQNMEQDKGALVTSRNIALADLLHHCSHHATAMRADAMRGILEIIQAHPSVLQSHGCQVSDAICACLADLSKEVRHTALLPLQHILRTAGPSSNALMADCACTHVGRGLCDTKETVQDDALAAAKMIVALSPTAAARHAPLLLQRVVMILGTAAADAAQTDIRLRVMTADRRVEVCFVLRQLLKLCAVACNSANGSAVTSGCSVAHRRIDDYELPAAGSRVGAISGTSSSSSSSSSSMYPVIARLLIDAWRELDLNFADDDVQLPALLADSLLAVVKLQQQQQQQQHTSVACWVTIMNSINLHIHTPVSSFLRSGRLHSSWLTPLSAVTASFLRLCILSEVDAPLPAALWEVCKRCMQAKPTEALAEVCLAAIRHPRLLPELADGGCITLAGLQVPASDMSSTFWQFAAAAWGGAGAGKGSIDVGEDGVVMVGEALLSAVERHAQAALVNGVGKVPMRWEWLKSALLAAPRLAFTGPQRITLISLKLIITAVTHSSPNSLASETWSDSAGKKLAPIFRAKLKTGEWIKGPFGGWNEVLQRLAIQTATLHPRPPPDLVSAMCDAVCTSSVSSSVAMLAMTSTVQRHQAHGPALCLSFAMSLAAKRPPTDVPEIAVCISSLLHSQSLADPSVLATSSSSAAAAIASAAANEPQAAMPLLSLMKHLLLLLPVHYLGPENSLGGGCCVAAVSRAFAIPVPLSAPFVDLAAEVLGQSCELLEAYVQAAADVASRDDGSAPAAADIAHTVLAIARHPSLENSIRHPSILHALSTFAAGKGGDVSTAGARTALLQEVKALQLLLPTH